MVHGDRGVDGDIVGSDPVIEARHFRLGDIEFRRDRLDGFGRQVGVESFSVFLHQAAKLEKRLFVLVGGDPFHRREGAEDILGDRSADPPHGIGGEPEATVGVEFPDRLHQADVAFRDQVGEQQAIAAVFLGDPDHQSLMAADQAIDRLGVASVAPQLGQGRFGLGVEDVISFDLVHVAPEAVLRRGRPAYRAACGSGLPTAFFLHDLPPGDVP